MDAKMTKFLEMFEPIKKGDFGLTEEAIYKSIQHGGVFIPVWGGSQEHKSEEHLVSENGKTKYNDPITIFEGTGIIVSLDGSAGSMTFVRNKRFALNHHAGFFEVKKGAENSIDPQFFALFYEAQLREAGVSEGSKTLSLKKLYSIDFEIPSYQIQQKIMSRIRPLLLTREKIQKMTNKLDLLKEKALSTDYQVYQAKDIPISKILNCLSGNSGLTEEMIYQKSQLEGERYIVLSSSTREETRLGEIPRCYINGKKLKIFEDKEGILVIRNGKAGTTFFLEKGKYTINDHAYILYLKDACEYDVSLRWLVIQYSKTFLEYSSSASNGTWNKTGFYQNVKIDIPAFDEQNQVVEAYNELEVRETKLGEINSKINQIFSRQIS